MGGVGFSCTLTIKEADTNDPGLRGGGGVLDVTASTLTTRQFIADMISRCTCYAAWYL